MFTKFQELWYKVESNLRSARISFQTADSTEDFQSVGIQCRNTILSLSEAVMEYQQLEERFSISNQNVEIIFERFFNAQFTDSSKDQFRAYTKACLKMSNALQHDRTSTYLQATLCIEATAHLVSLVDTIISNEESQVKMRFKKTPFASAEADFIMSWLSSNFDTHPVAKDHGFKFKGFMFQRSNMVFMATKNGKEFNIKFKKSYWTKEANRVSADRLLDYFIVELLSEQMKQEMIESGQIPT
jgi:hypothetical protein